MTISHRTQPSFQPYETLLLALASSTNTLAAMAVMGRASRSQAARRRGIASVGRMLLRGSGKRHNKARGSISLRSQQLSVMPENAVPSVPSNMCSPFAQGAFQTRLGEVGEPHSPGSVSSNQSCMLGVCISSIARTYLEDLQDQVCLVGDASGMLLLLQLYASSVCLAT